MARITIKELTTAMGLLAAAAEEAGIGPGAGVRWVLKRDTASDPYVVFWAKEGEAHSRCPLFQAGTVGSTARQAWDTMHVARRVLLQIAAARRAAEAPVPAAFEWVDDPAERAWLVAVDPAAVRDNAHRMYDFMRETGMGAESVIREAAFEKAAAALGIDYGVLYDAWMAETPVPQAKDA